MRIIVVSMLVGCAPATAGVSPSPLDPGVGQLERGCNSRDWNPDDHEYLDAQIEDREIVLTVRFERACPARDQFRLCWSGGWDDSETTELWLLHDPTNRRCSQQELKLRYDLSPISDEWPDYPGGLHFYGGPRLDYHT